MISILELARELGTSKTTIGRKIKELNIKNGLTISEGKYYLSDEQAEQIRETMKHHKKKNAAPIDPETMTHQEQQIIKKLLQQLEEKDAIIKRQQETIDTQQNHINNYLVLLAQAQELQKQALEQYIMVVERQEQEHKPGIFARLFRRKEALKLTEKPQETQETQEPAPQAEGSDGES